MFFFFKKSYIGELLVSFNPREKLDIFDDEVCFFFLNIFKSFLFFNQISKKQAKRLYCDSLNRTSQDPHLYWTCAETYRNAKEKQKVSLSNKSFK